MSSNTQKSPRRDGDERSTSDAPATTSASTPPPVSVSAHLWTQRFEYLSALAAVAVSHPRTAPIFDKENLRSRSSYELSIGMVLLAALVWLISKSGDGPQRDDSDSDVVRTHEDDFSGGSSGLWTRRFSLLGGGFGSGALFLVLLDTLRLGSVAMLTVGLSMLYIALLWAASFLWRNSPWSMTLRMWFFVLCMSAATTLQPSMLGLYLLCVAHWAWRDSAPDTVGYSLLGGLPPVIGSPFYWQYVSGGSFKPIYVQLVVGTVGICAFVQVVMMIFFFINVCTDDEDVAHGEDSDAESGYSSEEEKTKGADTARGEISGGTAMGVVRRRRATKPQ